MSPVGKTCINSRQNGFMLLGRDEFIDHLQMLAADGRDGFSDLVRLVCGCVEKGFVPKKTNSPETRI